MTSSEIKQAHHTRSQYLERASELLFSRNLGLSAHLSHAKSSFDADYAVRPSGAVPSGKCLSCSLQLLKGWSCRPVKSGSTKGSSAVPREHDRRPATVSCDVCRSITVYNTRAKLSRKQRRKQRLSLNEQAPLPVLVRPAEAVIRALDKPVIATPPAHSRKKLRPKDKTLEAALKRSAATRAPSGFNIDFADILKM